MAAHTDALGCPCILGRNQFDAGVPFGGYKHSGIGREKGQAALEHYTQVIHLLLRHLPQAHLTFLCFQTCVWLLKEVFCAVLPDEGDLCAYEAASLRTLLVLHHKLRVRGLACIKAARSGCILDELLLMYCTTENCAGNSTRCGQSSGHACMYRIVSFCLMCMPCTVGRKGIGLRKPGPD